MQFKIQTNKENFYSKYYSLINSILKLSDRELSIIVLLSEHIAQLVSIGYDLPSATMYALSTDQRIKLSIQLGISKFNLNNYIKTLRDKNILKHNKRKLEINPNIFINVNDINEFEFNAKLIIQD